MKEHPFHLCLHHLHVPSPKAGLTARLLLQSLAMPPWPWVSWPSGPPGSPPPSSAAPPLAPARQVQCPLLGWSKPHQAADPPKQIKILPPAGRHSQLRATWWTPSKLLPGSILEASPGEFASTWLQSPATPGSPPETIILISADDDVRSVVIIKH